MQKPWTPSAPVRSDVPRVYAKTRFAWIRSEPSASSEWLGYLWLGGSVPLRKAPPRSGPGCSVMWQPVEPRGYMCPNGLTATLDGGDPVVRAVAPYRAHLESPWPHRYGEVLENTERYEVIPDQRTQQTRERYRSRHLEQVARARRGEAVDPTLAGVDFSPAERKELPLPAFPFGVTEGRTHMRHRSAFAYTDEVETSERTFLLGADMSWVPKDYVRPYARTEFQGVVLGNGAKLPIAFFRGSERPSFRWAPAGHFEASQRTFPRLGRVELTGTRKVADGVAYLETREAGLWVREDDAVVPTPRALTPWRAPVGSPDATGRAPRGRATWLEVSILGGWLIAYEGTSPRYVTLISAGHGGSAQDGQDPLENAATPTGKFTINGKFATATMASGALVHGDVPWTQNFVGPYAVHAAYWHDDFGNLQSGGCVNVSPRDGMWLFDFTEPQLPAGWHGVRSGEGFGPSTTIVLHD